MNEGPESSMPTLEVRTLIFHSIATKFVTFEEDERNVPHYKRPVGNMICMNFSITS
jgi:hypothetical protein